MKTIRNILIIGSALLLTSFAFSGTAMACSGDKEWKGQKASNEGSVPQVVASAPSSAELRDKDRDRKPEAVKVSNPPTLDFEPGSR
jgi:hypothetical protein